MTDEPVLPTKAGGVLSGFSINTYLYLILAIVIIGLGVFAEFEHLKLKDVQAQIGTLDIANQIQEQTINTLKAANVAVQAIDADIDAVEQGDSKELAVLLQKLQDLNALAIKNPTLVEQKINAASDARMRCLALVTGAPIKKKETNSICPQVIERLNHGK
jgi:hypothetical protein